MKRIEFTTALYVDSENECLPRELANRAVAVALRYGTKHQDYNFGEIEISSVSDYDEEEDD